MVIKYKNSIDLLSSTVSMLLNVIIWLSKYYTFYYLLLFIKRCFLQIINIIVILLISRAVVFQLAYYIYYLQLLNIYIKTYTLSRKREKKDERQCITLDEKKLYTLTSDFNVWCQNLTYLYLVNDYFKDTGNPYLNTPSQVYDQSWSQLVNL